MKQRTAKKHRLKDYREEGFFFQINFEPNIPEDNREKIEDAFLEKIESLGLVCFSTLDTNQFKGLIAPDKKYSCTTEAQKEELKRHFLKHLQNCKSVGTSPNIDLNHFKEKHWDEAENPQNPNWTWQT